MKAFIKSLLLKKGLVITPSVYYNRSPIFNEKEIIFIHVPKVAGNGLMDSLGVKRPPHTPLYKFEIEDAEKFYRFFKIGFVRNPWDRMVSAYSFLSQGVQKSKEATVLKNNLSRFDSFEDMIIKMMNDEKKKKEILKMKHFRPQSWWLSDTFGTIEMDYIGRFERLQEGYEVLQKKIGIEGAVLSKSNSSKHLHYTHYYNSMTKKAVEQFYEKDIELFGYRFEAK